jgi:putative ABC transport system permease protein
MNPSHTATARAHRSTPAPAFVHGPRTPPLALRNVMHGGRRSLAAIFGVAFSLTMVLLQLGFLEAVKITASNNFGQVDFDIVLLSPNYEQFYAPGVIPLARLTEARSIASVISASPMYAIFNLWRCPAYPVEKTGQEPTAESSPGPLERWFKGAKLPRPLQRRELFVIGINLDKNPFREPIRARVEEKKPLLRLAGRILLNELSHPDFGWQLRDQVSQWELGKHAVTIVGGFPMLRGFAADSTVICSDRNFISLCGFPADRTSFGFLKVKEGTVASSLAGLKAALPGDVVALSRAEILDREIDHWVNQTSTGQLFAFGVLVAMIVAAVVVYQVLSNDVREHLPEYATLKAMGYSTARLSRVVVEQSLIYMIIAYVIAVLLAMVVYWLTEALAGIPMRLTMPNLLLTLLLAVVVGFLSGFLSLSRLRAAQPAELF